MGHGSDDREISVGRRERNKARVHARLRETALRLMADQGFEAVTVEQITRAADVAKGTFFNYYPSKSHVLVEYWGSIAGEILDFVRRRAPTSAREAFQSIYAFAAERATAEDRIFRLLVAQVLVQPQLQAAEEAASPEFEALFHDILAAGVRTGELRPDLDLPLAAQAIADLWTGALLELVQADGHVDLRGRVRARLDLIFDGLTAP